MLNSEFRVNRYIYRAIVLYYTTKTRIISKLQREVKARKIN